MRQRYPRPCGAAIFWSQSMFQAAILAHVVPHWATPKTSAHGGKGDVSFGIVLMAAAIVAWAAARLAARRVK